MSDVYTLTCSETTEDKYYDIENTKLTEINKNNYAQDFDNTNLKKALHYILLSILGILFILSIHNYKSIFIVSTKYSYFTTFLIFFIFLIILYLVYY